MNTATSINDDIRAKVAAKMSGTRPGWIPAEGTGILVRTGRSAVSNCSVIAIFSSFGIVTEP